MTKRNVVYLCQSWLQLNGLFVSMERKMIKSATQKTVLCARFVVFGIESIPNRERGDFVQPKIITVLSYITNQMVCDKKEILPLTQLLAFFFLPL